VASQTNSCPRVQERILTAFQADNFQATSCHRVQHRWRGPVAQMGSHVIGYNLAQLSQPASPVTTLVWYHTMSRLSPHNHFGCAKLSPCTVRKQQHLCKATVHCICSSTAHPGYLSGLHTKPRRLFAFSSSAHDRKPHDQGVNSLKDLLLYGCCNFHCCGTDTCMQSASDG
jgi:hypothetical protein